MRRQSFAVHALRRRSQELEKALLGRLWDQWSLRCWRHDYQPLGEGIARTGYGSDMLFDQAAD